MFDCLTCNWARQNKLLFARSLVIFLGASAYGLARLVSRFREHSFGKIQVSPQLASTLVTLEYLWVALSGPIFAIYFVTLLIWPPWVRNDLPERPWLKEIKSEHFKAAWKLHFRIVTRGNNPNLVASNCQDLQEVIHSIGLHRSQYVIEVVTDARVDFQKLSHVELDEVVVPDEYRCKNESKWKCRALHYAVETGVVSPEDWIIHLDEETKVDERCVTAIWAHIVHEQKAVRRGERKYPDMGQGAMLYGGGKHGKIENWITTLADSLRVCDDFGSFRAAFELRNKFTFGMKGSFVVASQAVEELVSWDHGPSLSLTEDATFNMVALKEHKVGTAWVDAFMYEQSPFSMRDFAKQRQRWYVGLWMCLMSSKTRSKHMMIMPIKMVFWTSQLVVIFLHLVVLFTDVMPIHLEMCLFIYMCGFSITFTPKDGFWRWLGLACLQILFIPFFLYMEFMGVFGGVREIITRNAGTNFHIVKKENAHNVQILPQKPADALTVPLLAADADVHSTLSLHQKIRDVEEGMLVDANLSIDVPLMDAGLGSLSMGKFRNELLKKPVPERQTAAPMLRPETSDEVLSHWQEAPSAVLFHRDVTPLAIPVHQKFDDMIPVAVSCQQKPEESSSGSGTLRSGESSSETSSTHDLSPLEPSSETSSTHDLSPLEPSSTRSSGGSDSGDSSDIVPLLVVD